MGDRYFRLPYINHACNHVLLQINTPKNETDPHWQTPKLPNSIAGGYILELRKRKLDNLTGK